MKTRGSSVLFLSLSLLGATGSTLLGCGGKAKPPAPPPAPVAVKKPAPPPPPVCVPAYEPAVISMAAADGSQAQFCVSDGAEKTACFGLDLESNKYAKLDDAPVPQPPALAAATARVESTPTEVKVCTGAGDDTCKVLKPKVGKGANEPIVAAINGAGTVAVLMIGNSSAGKGVAEIWDVPKGKKLTAIKYAKGDHKCGSPQVLGDIVFINAGVCSGPAAKGHLYSLKGKKLGEVGGKDFGTYSTTGVQVADAQWAFLEEGAGTIAIQDVQTGKVAKTIDLVSLWSDGAPADGEAPRAGGNPGESALVRGAEGKLIVVSGSPAAGNVGVVDVASGEVKVVRALPCPEEATAAEPAADEAAPAEPIGTDE